MGIQESASVNAAIVILKLAIVFFVIGVGAFYVNPANWHPFAPFGLTGFGFFGHTIMGQTGKSGEPLGMLAGAAYVFFAYIGFDSVSTHAEEARNPSRDVPIGIMTSLVLCTVLYIAMAAVLTGMVRYDQINIDAPVSDAFRQVGLPWAQFLISIGAVAGITSVLLVMMLSQPRMFLAMARDGLLPPGFFAAIHERFRTPWKSTILTGVCVATMGAFLPLRILAELVNIGTLLAFVIVCAAVLIMRQTHPEVPRPFRVPFSPLTPILGILACLLLMFSLAAANWLRLFVWLAIGFVDLLHLRPQTQPPRKITPLVPVAFLPHSEPRSRTCLQGPAPRGLAARCEVVTKLTVAIPQHYAKPRSARLCLPRPRPLDAHAKLAKGGASRER